MPILRPRNSTPTYLANRKLTQGHWKTWQGCWWHQHSWQSQMGNTPSVRMDKRPVSHLHYSHKSKEWTATWKTWLSLTNTTQGTSQMQKGDSDLMGTLTAGKLTCGAKKRWATSGEAGTGQQDAVGSGRLWCPRPWVGVVVWACSLCKLHNAIYDLCAFLNGCHISIKSLIKKTKDKTVWVTGKMGLRNTMTRNSWYLNT